MLRGFAHSGGTLIQTDDTGQAVWVDLLTPDDDEVARAEAYLGAALPRRGDMAEIEISSRLYKEDGAHFVTVLLPVNARTEEALMAPVCFAIAPGKLVTLRYQTPRPFTTYPEHAGRVSIGCDSADAVMTGLFEEVIDRIADILEWIGDDLDAMSRGLFRRGENAGPLRGSALQDMLEQIGLKSALLGDLRTCLLTLERAAGYVGPIVGQRAGSDAREALGMQHHDVHSLSEHAGSLEQKAALLLDATLGVISIEQNASMRVFSVIAVVFLPPTLIGSLYGMNFAHMPELSWPWGYPMAVLAMIVSAVLPITYFRMKGWF